MSTASPLRDARRWLPGVLISLIAIAVLFYLVDWRAVVLAFTTLNWRVVPFFIALYFASTSSRAMASRTLLENRPTFSQSYIAMMQGYLLNNLLPLRLGELGRAFLLGRKINVSMFHVLSTIIIERVIDLAMAAALTIFVLTRVVAMDWVKPVRCTFLPGGLARCRPGIHHAQLEGCPLFYRPVLCLDIQPGDGLAYTS